jgi:hypothetical protein
MIVPLISFFRNDEKKAFHLSGCYFVKTITSNTEGKYIWICINIDCLVLRYRLINNKSKSK